jgi:hypothetical protein
MFRVEVLVAHDYPDTRRVTDVTAFVQFANVNPFKFIEWVHANTPLLCTYDGGTQFVLRLILPFGMYCRDPEEAARAFAFACGHIESNGIEVLWTDAEGVECQLFVMN